MPESALQKEQLEASEIYGDKFILNEYPSDFSSIGSTVRLKKKSKVVWITSAVYWREQNPLDIYWPKNEGPFTQEGLIDTEDNQAQEFIFQIRKSDFISHCENLANRLFALFLDAKEEDANSPGITVSSLRNFYYFLNKYPKLKYPDITLTPDNNIYASWEDKHNRLLSVHFLPDGNTNFVIFKPNDKHPKQKIRLSGNVAVDSLMETVDPNGVKEWIFE